VLADARSRGDRVALWGAGSKAVAFLTTLGVGDEVAAVTDINPYRHGMFMPGSGHEVVPPAQLRTIQPQLVIAMNPIYVPEIERDLRGMGLGSRVVAV
jgi:hypothetical protein